MTYTEQLKCAQRELAMRQRVYPRSVLQGRMEESKAEHETACMAAIVETLKPLAEKEKPSSQMPLL